MDVSNSKGKVYFNNKYLADIKVQDAAPYITTYDSSVQVRQFTVKSNLQPITYEYTLPSAPSIDYANIYSSSSYADIRQAMVDDTMPENQEQIFQEFFDRERINWTNYRFTASYYDILNNEFRVSFNDIDKPLYDVILTRSNVTIDYWKDGKQNTSFQKLGIRGNVNKIIIDGTAGSLAVIINDEAVFRQAVDRATGGLFIMDYQNATLLGSQIEDRDSGNIKVYQNEIPAECQMILIDEHSYQGEATLDYGQTSSIMGYAQFNGVFDMAKVQVSLDSGQEVYFWVKQI